jgi:hypothetical protein
VTESNPKLKDETVAAIQKFLKTYVINLQKGFDFFRDLWYHKIIANKKGRCN